VAEIEQKPHRNHLANCTNPCSHPPAGYLEASYLRRPKPAIRASHTSQKRRLLNQPSVVWVMLRVCTSSVIVKVSIGGISLILTDVRFGLFSQNLVTNVVWFNYSVSVHVQYFSKPACSNDHQRSSLFASVIQPKDMLVVEGLDCDLFSACNGEPHVRVPAQFTVQHILFCASFVLTMTIILIDDI